MFYATEPASTLSVVPAAKRPSFPVPWGLFIVLALYTGGVLLFIWQQYWSSPDYQAMEHSYAASELLGNDDGKTISPAKLNEAFDHLLEAARLAPQEPAFAKHLERLRWRYDERKLTLDSTRKHQVEAVSELARRTADARAPTLVMGARDRGWASDQLLAAPRRTMLWSIPGAALIFVGWLYLAIKDYRARAAEREAELQKTEREVAAFGNFRRGLKNKR